MFAVKKTSICDWLLMTKHSVISVVRWLITRVDPKGAGGKQNAEDFRGRRGGGEPEGQARARRRRRGDDALSLSPVGEDAGGLSGPLSSGT